MQINDIIAFGGRQDSDTNPRFLKPGDFLRIVNGHAGLSNTGNQGVIESVNGTTQINLTFGSLAGGTNKVVGKCEHRESNRILYAVWNSAQNHRWIEHNLLTNVAQVIANGSALGFSEFAYINNADIVEDMLFWVDGSSPKKINIERARTYKKQQSLLMCFGGYLGNYKGSLTITFNGTRTLPPPFTWPYNKVIDTSSWNATSYSDLMKRIADVLNVDVFLTDILELAFDSGPDFVRMRETVEMQVTNDPLSLSFIFTPTQTLDPITIRPYFVYDNTYKLPLDEQSVSRAKQVPLTPPRARHYVDSNYTGPNAIKNRQFKFVCRYIFDDNEISTPGTATALIIDEEDAPNLPESIESNAILIEFLDENLLGDLRHNIRAVDIIFAQGNDPNWKLFRRLNTGELGNGILFYNDGYYQAVAQSEINIPYYAIPNKSAAQSFAVNRGFLTANEEGYDPIAVDMTASYVPVPNQLPNSSELFSVKGQIAVVNPNGTAVPRTDFVPGVTMKLDGFVVYLAGTPYYAVSKIVSSGTDLIFDFEIKDVPRGIYIIRVASHLLRYDLGYGPFYYLNKRDLSWQQTSTNVIRYSDSTVFSHEGTIVVDQDIEFTVAPAFTIVMRANAFNAAFQCGYIKDTETAVPAEANIRPGKTIEQVLVDIRQASGYAYMTGFYGGDDRVARCDHNGYFFFFRNGILASANAIAYLNNRTTGTLIASDDSVPFGEGFFRGIQFPGVAEALQGIGALTSANNWFQLVTTVDVSHNIAVASGWISAVEYFWLSQRSLIVNRATNSRTSFQGAITGKATDQDGIPLKGLSVVYRQTGRTAITNSEGNFAIPIYGNNSNGSQRTGALVSSYIAGLIVESPGQNTLLNITGIGTTVTPTLPVVNNLSRNVVKGVRPVSKNTPKLGGSYMFGIVYKDEAGRYPGAMADESLSLFVPMLDRKQTSRLDIGFFELTIRHRAPSWAKKWIPVRTRELKYIKYLQIPVFNTDVKFAKRKDDGTFEIQVTPDQDTVAYAIELNSIKNANSSGQVAAIAYTFSNGDRLRFVQIQNEPAFDAAIVGQQGFTIFVELEPGQDLPAGDGEIVELYAPRLSQDEDLYFEFGHAFDILPNGFHAANVQNQTGIVPAIARFSNGDSFVKLRNITDFTYYAQDPNVVDNIPSVFNSLFRPTIWAKTDDISNPGMRKINRGYVVRASNTFVQDTKINGLSAFEAGNQESLPVNEGEINTLFWDGRSLVTLTKVMMRRVLVGEAFVKNIDGTDDVLRAPAQLFGGNRPIAQYGTQHPEGVGRYRGIMLFWDQQAGAFILYDGERGINASAEYSFLTTSTELQQAIRNALKSRISTTFDSGRNEFVMAFAGFNVSNQQTLSRVFRMLPGKGIMGEYEFSPEELASTDNRLFSFQSGILHGHTDATNRMRFYGTQRKMRIETAFNKQSDARKVLDAIKVMATHAPDMPVITNDEGQLSELLASDFMAIEGLQFFSSFLYDKNTPNKSSQAEALVNGEEMRSTHFKLVFEFGQTGLVIFTAAEITSTLSR